MADYKWRKGMRAAGLKAQKVGDRLEKLQQKHGNVTADLVVREARKKNSPLHNGFEWDDTEAALEYRLHQARKIINAVVVTMETADGEGREIQAFVNVEQGGGYEDVRVVLHVADRRELLLAKVKREMEAFINRYHGISEVADVIRAMQKVA